MNTPIELVDVTPSTLPTALPALVDLLQRNVDVIGP